MATVLKPIPMRSMHPTSKRSPNFGLLPLKGDSRIRVYRASVKTLAIVALAVVALATPPKPFANGAGQTPNWTKLRPGLQLAVLKPGPSHPNPQARIHVLRIDPERFEFRLMNASASKTGRLLSARQWCRRYQLMAAINASMYQTDYLTSVSYMRTRAHINNPWLSKDMTILAFDRRRSDVPRITIIDRQCDDFDTLKPKYGTFIQSIRMISCTGRNVWQPQSQKWSTAAIGIDRRGWALFIHLRSPLSTHDFINILQALPLNIERAMYLEGGPQAQLYINAGGNEFEFLGGYTGQVDGPHNPAAARPLPNVIGIAPRGGFEKKIP